jgi:hypothetical protein
VGHEIEAFEPSIASDVHQAQAPGPPTAEQLHHVLDRPVLAWPSQGALEATFSERVPTGKIVVHGSSVGGQG